MRVNRKILEQVAKDVTIMFFSLFLAYFIMKSSIVSQILALSNGFYVLSAFIAGLFFTSVFTTAPAIVVLAKLCTLHNPFIIAFVGGAGALIGDFIIFRFLKDHLSSSVSALISIDDHKKSKNRIKHLFKHRLFRWSLAFIGALVIASPLPDELGLALMGASNITMRKFAIISYTFNTLGILLIGFIAISAVR